MRNVVAPMRIGEEGLGAVGGPFDRHARLLRRPQADDLLRIDVDLGAEGAAHIWRDDPELVLRRNVIECGKHQSRDMRVLARGPQRVVLLGGVVDAERRARLDRVRDQAVVDDVELGDVLRLGDRHVDGGAIADLPIVDQVVGRLRVKLRCVRLQRFRGIDDGGQLLPVDGDRIGGVARLAARPRHDDRDGLADIAHRVGGERRIGAHIHGASVLRRDRPTADQVADAVSGELRAGEHLDHARHLGRGGGVDLADLGVRVRRANERPVAHARHAHVVGVAAAAGDEALVFLADNACANSFNAHRLPPSISFARPSPRGGGRLATPLSSLHPCSRPPQRGWP